jgi:hypothetical protein
MVITYYNNYILTPLFQNPSNSFTAKCSRFKQKYFHIASNLWEGGITPTAVRRQGGGNNVDTKSWELFCCNLIWEGPKLPTK